MCGSRGCGVWAPGDVVCGAWGVWCAGPGGCGVQGPGRCGVWPSRWGTRVQRPCGLWDLPVPGMELVPFALQDGFLNQWTIRK